MDIETERGQNAKPFGRARSPAAGSRQGAHQGGGGRERASGGNRDATAILEPFVRQPTVLLTTYRRNGTPVGTPVHIAVDGNRAVFRTGTRRGN